jgi:hypothetical protein
MQVHRTGHVEALTEGALVQGTWGSVPRYTVA